MPVAPVKSSQRPKLMIRRGRKVTEGVEVQAVFADIRSGQLKPKHEFSTDGVNWRRLDSHPQLAKVFASAPEPEVKKKGPLVFIFLLILVAIVGAGLYFHPYLAFYNVQTASDSRNIEKLSEWVDYPGFNQNVKGQLDAQWNEISKAQISPTPHATLANPAGRAQVDKMIAALATPEAVLGFVRGETGRIGSWSQPVPKAPAVESAGDPLADVGLNLESVTKVMDSVNGVLARGEFRYEGLSSFVATIKTVEGKNLDLVYQRDGIGWKLTGVTLPVGPVRSSINDIAQSVLKEARAKARATSKKSNKVKKVESDKKVKSVKQKPTQVAKLTSSKSSKQAYMANIKLGRLSVGKGKKYLFGSPNPGLFATLANKGNRTLNEVEVTVYFYNGKGAIVSEKKLYPVSVSKYRPGRDNDPLKPQKVKKIGYLVKDFAPSSWAGKVQMRVTDIKFKE